MDKLKMHSVNIVNENIKKISALFPNTLTEVIKGYREDGSAIIEQAIDFDVLRQELSGAVVEGPEEHNKIRIIEESSRSLSGTLKRVKDVVEKFGDPRHKQIVISQLNDVDQRLPTLGEAAVETVGRIEKPKYTL